MRKLLTKSTIIAFILGAIVALTTGHLVLTRIIWKDACFGSNVGIVSIVGSIDHVEDAEYYSTAAPEIVRQIEELDANDDVKAIILSVDSPGGTTESSESIMLALKRASKPTVAVIRNVGASGGYMAAIGADRIFASRLSEVGSIGITQDFLDTSIQDRQNGIVFYDFSSGIYKSTGKEHGSLTEEQARVIMEDVMKSHDIFVEYVADNRNLPIEKVAEIATGRTFIGEDALELGLIDQIGGLSDVKTYLENKIGEPVDFCDLSE